MRVIHTRQCTPNGTRASRVCARRGATTSTGFARRGASPNSVRPTAWKASTPKLERPNSGSWPHARGTPQMGGAGGHALRAELQVPLVHRRERLCYTVTGEGLTAMMSRTPGMTRVRTSHPQARSPAQADRTATTDMRRVPNGRRRSKVTATKRHGCGTEHAVGCCVWHGYHEEARCLFYYERPNAKGRRIFSTNDAETGCFVFLERLCAARRRVYGESRGDRRSVMRQEFLVLAAREEYSIRNGCEAGTITGLGGRQWAGR
jgi:hypothetical protein